MAARLKSSLRWLHRWVGLTLGMLFALVSISGSLLLLQPQLFRWAHGSMIPAHLSQEVGSVDHWLQNASAAVPASSHLVAIWQPQHDHNISDAGMLIFGGREPGGFGNLGLTAVLVAPNSGEVLGVVDVDRSPAYAPIFLHSALWAGSVGRFIIGIMAVGIVVMLSIGLYLWWPGRSKLGRKLSARPLRNLKQVGRLHDWLGGWIFVVLLMLAATGLYLAQPGWVEPAMRALPAAAQDPAKRDIHASCDAPITLDQAIAKATQLVPGGTWTTIAPSEDTPGRWTIMLRVASRSASHSETHVLASLSCGIVQIDSTPAMRPARNAAELWIADLHDGAAFGRFGEIAIAIAGLAPLVLIWTGMSMWLKRRARARPRASASTETRRILDA